MSDFLKIILNLPSGVNIIKLVYFVLSILNSESSWDLKSIHPTKGLQLPAQECSGYWLGNSRP